MIDHITIRIRDYDKSKNFYLKALAPLGYRLIHELTVYNQRIAGFGVGERPDYWIVENPKEVTQRTHIALTASDREIVDQFYHEGIKAGGIDNGKPGLRPYYHPHHYGAFILDPDGNNIEAVCRKEIN